MAAWITPDPGVPVEYAGSATVLIDGRDGSAGNPLWRDRDERDVAAAYAEVPALRTVVDFIARAVASTPFQVFDRVGDLDRQRITSSPLALAMKSPGRWTTQAQLIGAITRDRLLTDRWCLLPYTDDDGAPRLLRVPPRMVRAELDNFGEVIGVVIVVEGKELRPARDEVIFWAGYSYSPSRVGTSPVRSVRRLLREMDQGDDYRQKMYANGVRSPFALVRPADAAPWTPEQRAKFIRSWKETYAGPQATNAGGTPLLEDGMSPVEFKGINPKDLEANLSRQAGLIEMANAYHMPPELLGLREAKYATMREYRSQLYRDVLGPIYVDHEQVFTNQLAPAMNASETTYVEANVEAKLRGSFEEQITYLQAAVGGPFMTRAEARSRLNLPHVDGSEELIVPLNVITGGQASPQDSTPPPGPPKASPTPEHPTPEEG